MLTEYQKFITKTHIQDAIIFFTRNNPNTQDQKNYYYNLLSEGLKLIGIPVLSTKQYKNTKGLTKLVFYWNDGESEIKMIASLAEKCINWFNEYVTSTLNQ